MSDHSEQVRALIKELLIFNRAESSHTILPRPKKILKEGRPNGEGSGKNWCKLSIFATGKSLESIRERSTPEGPPTYSVELSTQATGARSD
jgi:hypothetical protein